MKELSIEEKAKAYDEVIEKLRDFYRDYDTVSGLIDVKEELVNLIPELAESEDEKIRKDLISMCQTLGKEEWVAWLEKQGEPTDIPADAVLDGNKDGLIAETIRAKQGEQKPNKKYPKFKRGDILTDGKSIYKVLSWDYTEKNTAAYYMEGNGCKFSWGCEEADKKLKPVDLNTELSVEDEKNLNEALSYIQDEALKDFIKDRMQPKQEWSKEDKNMLFKVIRRIEQLDHYWNKPTDEKMIDWLKSLRPQNTWRPSDEQMDALLYVFRHYTPNATETIAWDALKTIEFMLEQLKKLREE